MSEYTAEQVFLRSEDVKYSADIDFRLTPACAADICKMLRDYAALLRERESGVLYRHTPIDESEYVDIPSVEDSPERESAKVEVSDDDVCDAMTVMFGNHWKPHTDAHYRMRAALEAVAPHMAGARVPDGAFIIDRGFQVERGQSIPTVLVGFRIEDWNARDAFAVMLAAAPKRGEE